MKMHFSQLQHEKALAKLADRMPLINTSGEDSLIVAADSNNAVSSWSERSDILTGAMVPKRSRRSLSAIKLR